MANIFNQYVAISDLSSVGIRTSNDPTDTLSSNQNAIINLASSRINSLTGGYVDRIGLANLTAPQQLAVKKATLFLISDWNGAGLSFTRINGGISMGGGSYQQSNPHEPDYIRSDIIDILVSEGLIKIADTFADIRNRSYDSSFDPKLDMLPISQELKNYLNENFVRKDKFVSPDGSINFIPSYNSGAVLNAKVNFPTLNFANVNLDNLNLQTATSNLISSDANNSIVKGTDLKLFVPISSGGNSVIKHFTNANKDTLFSNIQVGDVVLFDAGVGIDYYGDSTFGFIVSKNDTDAEWRGYALAPGMDLISATLHSDNNPVTATFFNYKVFEIPIFTQEADDLAKISNIQSVRTALAKKTPIGKTGGGILVENPTEDATPEISIIPARVTEVMQPTIDSIQNGVDNNRMDLDNLTQAVADSTIDFSAANPGGMILISGSPASNLVLDNVSQQVWNNFIWPTGITADTKVQIFLKNPTSNRQTQITASWNNTTPTANILATDNSVAAIIGNNPAFINGIQINDVSQQERSGWQFSKLVFQGLNVNFVSNALATRLTSTNVGTNDAAISMQNLAIGELKFNAKSFSLNTSNNGDNTNLITNLDQEQFSVSDKSDLTPIFRIYKNTGVYVFGLNKDIVMSQNKNIVLWDGRITGMGNAIVDTDATTLGQVKSLIPKWKDITSTFATRTFTIRDAGKSVKITIGNNIYSENLGWDQGGVPSFESNEIILLDASASYSIVTRSWYPPNNYILTKTIQFSTNGTPTPVVSIHEPISKFEIFE